MNIISYRIGLPIALLRDLVRDTARSCPNTLRRSSVIFSLALSALILTVLPPQAVGDSRRSSARDSVSSSSAVTPPIATLGIRTDRASNVSFDGVDLQGWNHIAARLVASGAEPAVVSRLLSHPSVPARETLYFSIEPKESRYNYRKLNSKQNRVLAMECYRRYRPYFEGAERLYQVPASVIVSILQVETACGQNTGNDQVFHRLLRLAAAATPENIEKNVERSVGTYLTPPKKGAVRSKFASFSPAQLAREVRLRGKYLEDTFTPHTAAVIEVAKYKGIQPLELRGSSAGAIGMPQFLPGHYLNFGVDGDDDGKIDLFGGADAVPSVAKYLKHYGWKSLNLPLKKQRAVIWEYNRSEPYIDTVLGMAHLLQPQILATRSPSGSRLNRVMPNIGRKEVPSTSSSSKNPSS